MIEVTCSMCSTSYSLPDSRAGEKTFCLECGSTIQVPELLEQTRYPATPYDHQQVVVGYGLIGIAGLLGVVVLLVAVWPEAAPEDPWRKGREAEWQRQRNEEAEKVRITNEAIERFEKGERERKIREQVEILKAIKDAGFDKK